MRRTLSSILLAALALFALVGCRPDAQLTFKKRPKIYRKIASLSPSTSEIALQVLVQPSLAGRSSADDFPMNQLKSVPIVAGVKPDYEKLEAVHPDLILYDAALFNAEDVAKLKTLGVDMFAVKADTLDDYTKELWELGELVGGETHVSDYVDRYNVAVATAKGKLPQPSPKVAIITPDVSGDDYIDGTDSFDADIVKQVGGTPVGPKGTRFVKLSPEMLAAANPDVILVSGTKSDFKGAVALANDPRFQTVAAIKNRRIKMIDSGVLLRRGSRVDLLVSAVYRAISGL